MTDFRDPNCRIECRSLPYRSGVVEVGVIDPAHIDLEVFTFDPAKIPAGADIRGGALSEDVAQDALLENVEIVLTEREAERLIELLRAAIVEAKRRRGEAV